MTQRTHQPREAGPALLLTGERRFGRYLIVLRGHELLITYTHYNLLIELLLAKRDPLSAGYAAAGAYPNVSRVAVWWREVDWRAAAVYCMTGIPFAALGARTLLALDPRIVEIVLGLFFLIMIPARRWLLNRGVSIGLPGLALVRGFYMAAQNVDLGRKGTHALLLVLEELNRNAQVAES